MMQNHNLPICNYLTVGRLGWGLIPLDNCLFEQLTGSLELQGVWHGRSPCVCNAVDLSFRYIFEYITVYYYSVVQYVAVQYSIVWCSTIQCCLGKYRVVLCDYLLSVVLQWPQIWANITTVTTRDVPRCAQGERAHRDQWHKLSTVHTCGQVTL